MYKYVQNELRLPNMLREGSVTSVHVHTDTQYPVPVRGDVLFNKHTSVNHLSVVPKAHLSVFPKAHLSVRTNRAAYTHTRFWFAW